MWTSHALPVEFAIRLVAKYHAANWELPPFVNVRSTLTSEPGKIGVVWPTADKKARFEHLKDLPRVLDLSFLPREFIPKLPGQKHILRKRAQGQGSPELVRHTLSEAMIAEMKTISEG